MEQPLSTHAPSANVVVRAILKRWGKAHDLAFRGSIFGRLEKAEVLARFDSACAYCATPIRDRSCDWDHVIPMSRSRGGLHVYGNLVPCCKECNGSKLACDWREFLLMRCPDARERRKREKRIADYQAEWPEVPKTMDAKQLRDLQQTYRQIADLAAAQINEWDLRIRRVKKARA